MTCRFWSSYVTYVSDQLDLCQIVLQVSRSLMSFTTRRHLIGAMRSCVGRIALFCQICFGHVADENLSDACSSDVITI